MYTLDDIRAVDPEIAAAITAEFDRQNSHIELIASENWVSPAVMSAMGSILTNKYAEGYPGKRYYGGCERVDVVEELAIRACGKAEADINVNGQHYSAVFQKGGSTWEVVAVSVQLKAGENTIIVSRKDGGVTGMWVDYIEFQ